MLQLYNLNKEKIEGLNKYKDLKIESTLYTGDKVLSFSYPKKYSNNIIEEGYIRTKEAEFVIKQVDKSLDSFVNVTCNLNVEELESMVEDFNSTEQTIESCINFALVGTGWRVRVDSSITKRRTVRKTNSSIWDIIQQAKKTYRVEIEFDTINKIVLVKEKIGGDKGVYFTDERNLKTLSIQSNSYDFYTRILAIGKDDLKVEVENYNYSNKRKTLIWKDERYTDETSLREDAILKLEEISKPYRSYSADVIDLAKLNENYKDILSYKLGDTITLISKDNRIREKQRIVKTVEYPDNPEENTVEIANTTLSFEDVQKEFQETSDTVNNITTDNGTVDGNAINGISTKQIYDFETSVGKITDLTVVKAEIENLYATTATIQQLNAVIANIGELNATKANITDLNAINAKIANLQADKANITDLTATNIKFNVGSGGTLDLQTLLAKHITGENGQFLNITSSNTVIANAVIKDAMIENISVNKILAGDISATKFRIVSDTGNMLIYDNTIQIRDNNRVRVQIGKDASNDYNMYVWDSAGKLMFDATGLKADGIKNKIIRDDMISDNANIDGAKLNISSLITEINKDTNTSVIKSSKVQIDTLGQTLDVAFNSLKSSVDGFDERIQANTTAITVAQGKIEGLISENTIIKGDMTTISDKYTSLKATVDSINTTVASHTSSIGTITDNVSGLSGKVTTVENKYTSLEQNLNGFKTTVANNYSTKTELSTVDGKVTGLTSRVSTAETSITQLNNKIALKVEATDIITAINNVQIGGRNLIKDSNFIVQATSSSTAPTKNFGLISGLNLDETFLGKTVVFSYFVHCIGNRTNASGSLGNRFGIHGSVQWKNSSTGATTTHYPFADCLTGSYKNTRVSMKYTFNPPSGYDTIASFSFSFQPLAKPSSDNKETWKIGQPKLEIGTKATEWTPAPEDVDSAITSVDNKVTTTNNKVATIETNLNGITQRVSSTESTVSTHTTQLGTVDSRINTAKTSAISTAASDATTKANNAQTNATNAAKSYTDGQITTVNKTITDKVAEIKTTTDSITSRVSKAETTLTSTTNTANSANSKIDNLVIGGRNLFLQSNIDQYGLGRWGNNGGTGTVEGTFIDGTKAIKIVGNAGITYNSYIKLKRNTIYTYSMMMHSSAAMTISGSTPLHMWVNSFESAEHLEIVQGTSGSIAANTWTKIWITFKTPNSSNTYYMKPFVYGIGSNTVYIAKVKVEEGNKATDWTPAPEDVDSSISSLTSRMTSTEQKITSSAIISTVQATINTAKTEAINSANSSTDTKLKNYSTTTQMNTAIQQKADSITSTVSSNYLSKTDATNTYATKSSLTQTTDKIIADFKASGGYNLLKNSDAKNGTNFWVSNGGGLSIGTAGANPFYGQNEFKTSFPNGMRYTEDLRLKSNTDYVYEAWIYTNTAITSSNIVPLHFWCSSEAGVAGQSQCTIIDYRQSLNVNNYTKVYVHFKTKSGNVFFRPFIYGTSTSSLICVKQISLSEGTVEQPWTPHPDEVYSGSTVIDASGVTIKNGALKVQNKAGSEVLKGDTSGNLTITGTFINKNSNGVDAIKIDNTNIYFYDWERNARELGVIYSSALTDFPNVRGFSLAHSQDGYMSLGYRTGTNTFKHYMTFDKYAKNPAYASPIRVHESALFHGAVNLQDRVYIPNQLCFESGYSATTPQIFKNTGDSRNILCAQVSVNAVNDGFMIQGHTGSLQFSILAGNSYPIKLHTHTQVNGAFTVTGSKNSLQETKNYGERLINAFETAEYYYSDLGFGKINNDGECYISIDDILQECINLDCKYHVFTQVYNGFITKIDRQRDYFIVYGEPDTEFSWQYIAKRIGYENVRLDVPQIGTVEDIPVFTDKDLEVKTTEDTLLDLLTFDLEKLLMED